ncbi:bifunctional phosphoribosylaminoimidazolecarboxamide formyltransferase/IMP cyclohydrolase [alpha proteobacterium BAL199]|jgi:ATP synthase protein I|nr:bifunctional phosphoribosylaminoimidazolecarboxamide formyltransferase/IMP cyclohydrolase [alpha proteobacterium BAL199]
MQDRDSPPSLDDLDARLKKARGSEERVRQSEMLSPNLPGSAMGLAFRVGVEMVAGVAVGTGIGYALDYWLGTGPWLMIVFFFLGAAGGMMNVYRAAMGQGMAVGYRKPADDAEDGRRDETEREG